MQEFDIAVIGAGSAGPKAARTAAKFGAKVVIFEEALIGGECLYTGCVPSKALIHSATLWNRIQRSPEFGLPAYAGEAPDFGKVMTHARRMVEEVGSGSAVDSFAKQGIVTVCERAEFIDPHTVVTNKTRTQYRAKHFVLCTGSLPSIPKIPGLEEVGCDTNRTVFDYISLPKRMVVIGGGPIGCELGQVFARFGSEVTILHNGPRILSRDDANTAQVLMDQLTGEGIRIVTSARVANVEKRGSEKVFIMEETGEEIVCDAILVAAGRKSNVGSLGLEAAGVTCEEGGRLHTNAFMQTNVPHIWAAGDVTSEFKFTHVVSYEGAVAATNILATLRGKELIPADYRVIPRVTYTDPEVASVGLTPALARVSHPHEDVEVSHADFADLDKPVLTGAGVGFVQIVSLKADGTILGGQIVGQDAGSLISEICLAMRARLPISEIGLTMHAYPTLPEVVEAAAYESSHGPLSSNIPWERGQSLKLEENEN